MEKEQFIPVRDFCIHHHLEISFIHILEESGLVETVMREETQYLPAANLSRLEKFVRLHQELSIHPEDLDVVSGLLEHIELLQQKLNGLQSRIAFYEQFEEGSAE